MWASKVVVFCQRHYNSDRRKAESEQKVREYEQKVREYDKWAA